MKTEVGSNFALFNYLDFVAENAPTDEDIECMIEAAEIYAKRSDTTDIEQLTNFMLDNCSVESICGAYRDKCPPR